MLITLYFVDVKHEVVNLDNFQGNDLVYKSFLIRLVGGATVDNGGVRMNGRNQYMDFSADSSGIMCDGNLDYCPSGFTVSFDIRPGDLSNDMYLLSSAPINIYSQQGHLTADLATPTNQWTVTSPDPLREDTWYGITVTWDEVNGVVLYINDMKVAEQESAVPSSREYDVRQKMYIGRASDAVDDKQYADMTFKGLQMWRSKRDVLIANRLIASNSGDNNVQQNSDQNIGNNVDNDGSLTIEGMLPVNFK